MPQVLRCYLPMPREKGAEIGYGHSTLGEQSTINRSVSGKLSFGMKICVSSDRANFTLLSSGPHCALWPGPITIFAPTRRRHCVTRSRWLQLGHMSFFTRKLSRGPAGGLNVHQFPYWPVGLLQSQTRYTVRGCLTSKTWPTQRPPFPSCLTALPINVASFTGVSPYGGVMLPRHPVFKDSGVPPPIGCEVNEVQAFKTKIAKDSLHARFANRKM